MINKGMAMEELNISKRLQYIAGLVKRDGVSADIGTDHGYLPVFLAKNDICRHIIAMDVRKGPLKKAEANIKAYGVEEKISLRLSDGLDKLEKEEADTITISGMGGRLIQSILLKGLDKLTKRTKIIVSPQSEIREFRIFLKQNGFLILRENMLEEEGQFYPIIECVYLGGDYSNEVIEEAEYRYGKQPLTEKNESLKKCLLKELATVNDLIDRLMRLERREQALEKRIEQLEFDKQCICMALEYYKFDMC